MSMPPVSSYKRTRDDLPTIIRWARVLLTLALLPLGISTLRNPQAGLPMVGDINTAVHEFGHMLFMPFGVPVLGETMVILGGSLLQVAFPLIFVGYFLFAKKHRDLHAAMICLWWAATSMVGLSVYVADARARELTLLSGLTGMESDGHDWYNLLSQWGLLSRDLVYAARLRTIAWLMFWMSTLVGLYAPFMAPRPKDQQDPAD